MRTSSVLLSINRYDLEGNLDTMIDKLEVFRLPESIKEVAMANMRLRDKAVTPAMACLLGDAGKEATKSSVTEEFVEYADALR